MIVFILSMQHCLMGAHTHHTSVDRHKRFGCLIAILHGSNSVYFYEIHEWRQLLMCTHISVISSLKGEEKNLFSLNLKAAKRFIQDDMHSAALHATLLIAHQPGCS